MTEQNELTRLFSRVMVAGDIRHIRCARWSPFRRRNLLSETPTGRLRPPAATRPDGNATASKMRSRSRVMDAVGLLIAMFSLSAAAMSLVIVLASLAFTPLVGVISGMASELLP